jgi:hypothetical protein
MHRSGKQRQRQPAHATGAHVERKTIEITARDT